MSSSARTKQIYRPKLKLEVFFTGGAVALSPLGHHVACACGDEVKVVDFSSGSVTHTLQGDSEPVTAIAFSPDGHRLYSASRSLQQRVWDIATGRSLRSWKGHVAPIAALAVDDSGALLASCSADRSVRVWDTAAGFCTHVFTGHTGIVFSVAFQPKQLTLLSGSDDADVRVWDLVTKTCISVLKGHFSAVTSLSVCEDGWTLLSGSRDRTVHVWDLRTPDAGATATIPIHEAVEGVVALPATSVLAVKGNKAAGQGGKKAVAFVTAGERGRVRVWRSDTGRCLYEQPEHAGGLAAGAEMTWLAALPDAIGVVASTGDCRLISFHSQAASESSPASLSMTRQLVGNNDEVTDICFIGPPAAPTHLAVATNGPAIRLFDVLNLGCTSSLEGHSDIVLCLAAFEQPPRANSSDVHTTLLLSGSKDNTLRLWLALSGRCIGVGEGHIASVTAVALSNRRAKFAVSGGADNLLKVWDIPSAAELPAGADNATPPAMRVTAAVAAHDKDINAIAVSPNDSLLATASQDRTAKVWRLPQLVAVMTLRGHKRGVWDVAFSPVDQAVATASGDKTLRLWSVADGSCLRTLEGHTASVLRCAFLTSGTQVVTSGADGLVKLWGVSSGECVSTFDEHEGKVWAMAVGGGEALLATGAADATVALWEDCTAADQEAAALEQESVVLKQQHLSNALHNKDFGAAAELAFEMQQPRRLLAVVESIHSGLERPAATAALHKLAGGWDAEQLKTALEYCREWNTNSRVCHSAQELLSAILLHHTPQALLAISGIGDLLEGLAAYTQNHYSRVARLQRSAYLLDYTLASMDVLMPTASYGDAPPQPSTPPQTPVASQPLLGLPGLRGAEQNSRAAPQSDESLVGEAEAAETTVDISPAAAAAEDAFHSAKEATPLTAKRKRCKSDAPISAKATNGLKRKSSRASQA